MELNVNSMYFFKAKTVDMVLMQAIRQAVHPIKSPLPLMYFFGKV